MSPVVDLMRQWLLLLILPALLCACGQNPSEVARDYLANLKLGRYQTCYRMLSARDKLAQTPAQFAANMPLAPDVDRSWFDAVEAVTQYGLNQDVRGHGLKVVVEVAVTTVDSPLWERAIESVYGAAGAARAARASLLAGNYPRSRYTDDLVLVKEFHRWRVFADLAGRDRIARLHRAALRLYHEHRFAEAVQSYDTLLAALEKPLASGRSGALARYTRERALVEAAGARAAEGSRYIAALRVTNVARHMTVSGKAGMFGQITNHGDKPVDEVGVTVFYYTAERGKRSAVYTANYAAIANPIEFTGFAAPPTPLLPGETRGFGLRLRVPAAVQEDATPELRVTSLVFPPWPQSMLRAAISSAGAQARQDHRANRSASGTDQAPK